MAVISVQTDTPGLVGVNPATVRIMSTDTLATVTTANYLNKKTLMGYTIKSTDKIEIRYGYVSPASPGTFAVMVPVISSAGVITLRQAPGQVVFPVEAGRFAQFVDANGSIEDSGIGADQVLATGGDGVLNGTDFQKFVSIQDVILASVGTWTKTRVARGNYSYLHTAADETAILGIDLTPILRTTATTGVELTSIDVIYTVGTLALDGHTLTLDAVSYANNAAATITNVPLTGSLATATQANPYVSNIVITTPAYLNVAGAKYVLELTVNAAATSAYSCFGLNLNFTKTSL